MPSPRTFRIVSTLGTGLAILVSVALTVGPPRLSRAAPGAGSEEPCVSLVLRTTERRLGADGVRQETEHRDRFLRCGARVWIERIVPPGAPRVEGAAEHGHDLPPLHGFARLVERGASDPATLALVSAARHLVVEVGPEAFDQVGFSGDWASAAHLVAPQRLATFAAVTGAAPAGARWLERRDRTGTVKVLWSDALGLALRIETRRADGAAESLVAAEEVGPPPAVLPWAGVGAFERKDINDYGD